MRLVPKEPECCICSEQAVTFFSGNWYCMDCIKRIGASDIPRCCVCGGEASVFYKGQWHCLSCLGKEQKHA